MPAGRPKIAHAGTIYSLAQQLFLDFQRLVDGGVRASFDFDLFDELYASADKTQLAEIQIREGQLKNEPGPVRRELSDLWMKREWLISEMHSAATRLAKVPGRPEILRAILNAQTPEEIRRICKNAYIRRSISLRSGGIKEAEICSWPISQGSMLPIYLSQHADAFIAAKRDRRFPRSARPTSYEKQLWFLSRALAGAVSGVTVRTSINLVGSKSPKKLFEESRSGKPQRRRPRKSPSG